MAADPNKSWAAIDYELWLLFVNSRSSDEVDERLRGKKCFSYYYGTCNRYVRQFDDRCVTCNGNHPFKLCFAKGVMSVMHLDAHHCHQSLPTRANQGIPSSGHVVKGLWDIGPTPIQIDSLKEYLLGYSNKVDAELLLSGFTSGFSLHYTSSRSASFSKHLRSAF